MHTYTIEYPTSVTYTGKKLKPAVVITTDDDITLASNEYSVKYSNNKNSGIGTFKITLKKSYKSDKLYLNSQYFNFTIEPIDVSTGSGTVTLNKSGVVKKVVFNGKKLKKNRDYKPYESIRAIEFVGNYDGILYY